MPHSERAACDTVNVGHIPKILICCMEETTLVLQGEMLLRLKTDMNSFYRTALRAANSATLMFINRSRRQRHFEEVSDAAGK